MGDDIFDQQRDRDLGRRQRELDGKVRHGENEIARLQRHIDRMALVNQALYEIVRQRLGFDAEDLRRKIQEIDKRDGFENSKVKMPPLTCPKCEAVSSPGSLKCVTCGAVLVPSYPFHA